MRQRNSLQSVWREYNGSVSPCLEGRITFEGCYSTFEKRCDAYEIVAKHENLPKEWNLRNQSLFFFLQNLRRSMQDNGQWVENVEPGLGEEGTAKPQDRSSSWLCGWGPCRVIWPSHLE